MLTSSKFRSNYFKEFQLSILRHLNRVESDFYSDKTFIYRGLNLRSAIQKKLFFKHLENDESRNQFYSENKFEISWKKSIDTFQIIKHYLKKLSNKPFPYLASKDKGLIVFLTSRKHEVFVSNTLRHTDFQIVKYSHLQHLRRPTLKGVSSFLLCNHYDLLVFTESFFQWIEETNPKKIILIEGNKPEDSLVIEICNKLKIPAYIIQHGWSFTPHLGFRDLGDATFLSWGKKFSSELQPFNQNTKFEEVGHPLLLEENSIEMRNENCISIFLQAPINIIGTDTFNEVISLGIELAENNWKVLFREHPSWPLEKSIKARILESSNTEFIDPYMVSLDQQLQRSSYGLTIYSSVGYECLVKGVIPVFLPFNMEIDLKPNLETSGLALVFNSKKTCLDYFSSKNERRVEDLTAFKNYLKTELKSFFTETGEDAFQKLNSALYD